VQGECCKSVGGTFGELVVYVSGATEALAFVCGFWLLSVCV